MAERKVITDDMEAIHIADSDDLDDTHRETMDAFIERVRAAFERVPAPYRASAWVRLWGGACPAMLTVEFERPETDEEFAKRVACEREREEANERWARREYERLKAKFEGTG